MKLPRGYKLTNERIEGNSLTYDLHVARWRVALHVLKLLTEGRICVSFRRMP